jgi:hypothetical protein
MKKNTILVILVLLQIAGCATFKEQSLEKTSDASDKKIIHTVYLTGGYGEKNSGNDNLSQFTEIVKETNQNSTFLLLGDNISSQVKDSLSDAPMLNKQAAIVKDYKGKAYFLAGDHEWKYKNSRRQQALQNSLVSNTGYSIKYMPKNGSPISKVSVNDNLDIIFVDSQWYISNWDAIEYINEDSPDIKTRRRFLEELESMIRDAAFKNVIIAMHHPIFSNGKHGGKYSFNDYQHPLPIIGLGDKTVRKLGGTSPEDIAYSRYKELASFVAALAKLSDHIVIVSGHENSLQYLEGNGIHQIISGSLSKSEATKLSKELITAPGGKLSYKGIYSSSEKGYAKLNYYQDGSSDVEFHSFENNKLLYRHSVNKALPNMEEKQNNTAFNDFSSTTKAQILTKEETSKSWFYKLFWGKHYRDYYSREVTVKTALLDTLYGGVTILKEGGGHQSQSLRLQGKNGKQYVMRSLHKDALKFLRFKLKGIAFNADAYDDTATEELVSDFFTTAHPYAQLAVNDLAGFGDLNDKYGNGLYYIEERPSKDQKDFMGYQHTSIDNAGKIVDFANTIDVLEKLRNNDRYTIDKRQYIRSRIFDMLIGDWDRHEDQWRWALRETGNKSGIYSPIPRDRDAAFSKFDGAALAVVKNRVPETRFWQSYDDNLDNVKWFNSEAYNLDKIFVSQYDASIWNEEAISIQKGLTDAVIDKAFLNLPQEMQDQALEDIKTKLKKRLSRLPESQKEKQP